jgi:hypothetical protein
VEYIPHRRPDLSLKSLYGIGMNRLCSLFACADPRVRGMMR